MKLLLLATLIPAGAVAVCAQAPITPSAPEGIAILTYSARAETRLRNWDTPRDSATSQSVEDLRIVPARDPNVSQAPTPAGTLPATRPRDRTNQTKGAARAREEETPAPQGSPSDREVAYTYEAKIKNVGDGTITGVAWEYLFLEPGSGTLLARHGFLSFSKAEAGKSVTLRGKSFDPPTRVISAAGTDQKRTLFEEKVIIRCVAYKDGSVRRLASVPQAECAAVKNGERKRND